MSASKEEWRSPYGGTGKRGWVDASPRHRCPVCNGDSWCQILGDGSVVLCKRHDSGRGRVNRAGVTYYVHRDESAARTWAPMGPRPSDRRASPDVLDTAYQALLDRLCLDGSDRETLRARGLDDAAIARAGYRTLPLRGRAALARAVMESLYGDPETDPGIPGIVRKEEAGRGWWSLAGAPGILIPVRDLEGRIMALKVRRPDPCEGPRYLYLTSTKDGGPSAASVLHVPVAARALRETADTLVVTEGELKADVATHLLGKPVVGVPGVGSWALALDLAKARRPARVVVAFDMDRKTKPPVAAAQRELIRALRLAGWDGKAVGSWSWPPQWKGIDDYLAARARGEVAGV